MSDIIHRYFEKTSNINNNLNDQYFKTKILFKMLLRKKLIFYNVHVQ